MFLLVLIPISIYFIINAVIADKFDDIARLKGYGPEMHCFAMCFWLGILGCLYVIALPDRGAREVQSNTNSTSNPVINAEKYDALVKKAEKFKDTIYDRDFRISVYESIVKEMQSFANYNFMNASLKLEEYKAYLELLKMEKIKQIQE